MRIEKLELSDFRNYDKQILIFHKNVNILLGKNGQGKSNLIESVYILSMGKSFRTQRDTEMIRFDADFLRVCGTFLKGERTLDIEVMISQEGKRFRIDGFYGSKNADLLENAYMVVFSPEDMKIIKEDPERRRRFMDRELFQLRPLYYKNLSRYKKSLLHRNNLLKSDSADENLLGVWDENLVKYGVSVIKERHFFIEKLKNISRDIHYAITDGRERLDIEYEPDVSFAEDPSAQRALFSERLDACRETDRARRYTGAGPHRDDIGIAVEGVDVRRFGSQGQQRTAALSLKLAEISIIKDETGEDAIILLDDVLSELDGERQRFLIRALSDNQIFISAAEMSGEIREGLPEGFVYNIEGGHAERIR
jgi:DNA replication and repair protein RecF